jgi:hypothetical protein
MGITWSEKFKILAFFSSVKKEFFLKNAFVVWVAF